MLADLRSVKKSFLNTRETMLDPPTRSGNDSPCQQLAQINGIRP